jgi:glycosyltransferase involved in cell wall biosynthesis
MPKISVIIPTCQHAHFVGQAIESVLAQTYKDYEIIVVDDASTDSTSEVLTSLDKQSRVCWRKPIRIMKSL